MRLLKIWRESTLYEERIIDGWEATVKINAQNYYAFNLTSATFEPSQDKN